MSDNELVKQNQEELLQYLNSKELGVDLPNPFERDIFLFDTFVAGTTHIENIEEISEKINIGDKLKFYREFDNKVDHQAIRIETQENIKIGYVPQQDNVIFSRLMDSGKEIFAKVEDKEMRGRWLKMGISIYLHES